MEKGPCLKPPAFALDQPISVVLRRTESSFNRPPGRLPSIEEVSSSPVPEGDVPKTVLFVIACHSFCHSRFDVTDLM